MRIQSDTEVPVINLISSRTRENNSILYTKVEKFVIIARSTVARASRLHPEARLGM
jgi:hypothetical protein